MNLKYYASLNFWHFFIFYLDITTADDAKKEEDLLFAQP